jgi:nucleoside-diphosphate-sugar epimerase
MIRWITSILGTAAAGSPDIEQDFGIIDVRDLVDKPGNNPDHVRAKIDEGVAWLNAGKRVVVCCDYGISRSNSIAVGILSRYASMPFDQALCEVRRTTGEEEIKLEPLNIVRAALAGNEPAPDLSGFGVLITGGSGFIGSALVKALGGSVPFVAPARNDVDLLLGSVALDQLVRTKRINCVVHLANPRVYTSAKAIGETLTMLRNALDVCRENGLRLVYLSGWEVYSGYRAKDLLANESLPRLPKGPYGEAKMLCEILIEHYRKLHALNAVIVRSSPVYGPGSDRPKFIYNFLNKARKGALIHTHEYANGAPHLDLLHIDDLIEALVAVLRSDVSDNFNVGSGQLFSTYEVAATLVAKTQSVSQVRMQKIDDYAPNIRMDYHKARTILGWKPVRTFDMGLNEIISQGERNDGF